MWRRMVNKKMGMVVIAVCLGSLCYLWLDNQRPADRSKRSIHGSAMAMEEANHRARSAIDSGDWMTASLITAAMAVDNPLHPSVTRLRLAIAAAEKNNQPHSECSEAMMATWFDRERLRRTGDAGGVDDGHLLERCGYHVAVYQWREEAHAAKQREMEEEKARVLTDIHTASHHGGDALHRASMVIERFHDFERRYPESAPAVREDVIDTIHHIVQPVVDRLRIRARIDRCDEIMPACLSLMKAVPFSESPIYQWAKGEVDRCR